MLSGMSYFLALLVTLMVAHQQVQAQGLPGADINPNPHPGRTASTAGPLLPGKTDAERWKLVSTNLETMLGKNKAEIKKLFGKVGGKGSEKEEMVYRITEALPRKPGGLHHIELSLLFSKKDLVHKVSVVRVTWL